jgi:hypothetical protein
MPNQQKKTKNRLVTNADFLMFFKGNTTSLSSLSSSGSKSIVFETESLQTPVKHFATTKKPINNEKHLLLLALVASFSLLLVNV